MKVRTRYSLSGLLLACAVLLCPLVVCAQGKAKSYEYFSVGDVTAKTPGKTSPGLLLMGGGREIVDAFKWFAAQAGHGHIVILRASGDDELQNWIYRDVGGVASVQTLIFHARAPASDPRVLAIVKHADGIFIAGGDQANYVRFWKGTPLGKLINAHVRAGKPLGGTSAGLAILGEWGYGAMDGGSITSPEALRDPAGSAVTLVDHFVTLPLLKGIITDTHFVQRERLGRLLAFVARTAKDQHTAAVTGLGVDQDSALLVDANGDARLLSWHADGHAWLIVPEKLREVERKGGRAALDAFLKDRVAPGKPLNLDGYVVSGIGISSHLHLPDCSVENAAFVKHIDVTDGQLVERAGGAARSGHASRADLIYERAQPRFSLARIALAASPRGGRAMRPIPLMLMTALTVTGCAAQAARDPVPPPAASAASSASTTQANLDGTEWRFVEVNGTAVPNGVNATLRLHGSRASGRTGCNAYGASFETGADGSAKFGQAMSTKMACLRPAGAMQVERSVLDALQHTARVERNGDNLTLLDASGKPLAKLQRQTP